MSLTDAQTAREIVQATLRSVDPGSPSAVAAAAVLAQLSLADAIRSTVVQPEPAKSCWVVTALDSSGRKFVVAVCYTEAKAVKERDRADASPSYSDICMFPQAIT